MEKQKKTVEGYIGRSETELITETRIGEYYIPNIWNTEGTSDMWSDEDWPPKKVRITIEEL